MEGDAVDLYAGLALPPPKKRTTDDAAAASTNGTSRLKVDLKVSESESSAEPPAKKPKTAAPNGEIDVASAVARLKTHMVVDKKFTKASALFHTLMSEKLTADTSDVFLDALTVMIAAKGVTWSGKREFAQLIQLLVDKQDVFPESKRTSFPDWQLLGVTHHDLFTDDTFQFARAAKQIKLRLDAAVAEPDREARDAQLTLLMPLLRTLFTRHGVAWAKTSVESVLAVCTRHRLLFQDAQRAEVDQWTKTVQERRHSATITRSAASDARRNIVELTRENASQAKAKVGRSNHPLFNRDS